MNIVTKIEYLRDAYIRQQYEERAYKIHKPNTLFVDRNTFVELRKNTVAADWLWKPEPGTHFRDLEVIQVVNRDYLYVTYVPPKENQDDR